MSPHGLVGGSKAHSTTDIGREGPDDTPRRSRRHFPFQHSEDFILGLTSATLQQRRGAVGVSSHLYKDDILGEP